MPLSEKAEYYHHRQRSPDDFDEDTYKTVPLNHTKYKGEKFDEWMFSGTPALARIARLKKNGKWAIQSILIPKDYILEKTPKKKHHKKKIIKYNIIEIQPKNSINISKIKYLETQDHNGEYNLYFKISNQWYHIIHNEGYVNDVEKITINTLKKEINYMFDSKYKIVKDFRRGPNPDTLNIIYDNNIKGIKLFLDKEDLTLLQIINRELKNRNKNETVEQVQNRYLELKKMKKQQLLIKYQKLTKYIDKRDKYQTKSNLITSILFEEFGKKLYSKWYNIYRITYT